MRHTRPETVWICNDVFTKLIYKKKSLANFWTHFWTHLNFKREFRTLKWISPTKSYTTCWLSLDPNVAICFVRSVSLVCEVKKIQPKMSLLLSTKPIYGLFLVQRCILNITSIIDHNTASKSSTDSDALTIILRDIVILTHHFVRVLDFSPAPLSALRLYDYLSFINHLHHLP